MIIKENSGVTVIGGGYLPPGALETARAIAPVLLAADGAAAAALKAGWKPAAVIGDMDSIDAETLRLLPPHCIHRISEQNSTDFDKVLRNVEAQFVLGIGLLGARLDHELAALSTLTRYPRLRCVLIGEHDICCLAPVEMCLRLPVGTRLSLFPMADVRGRSRGLRWPIDGILFTPDTRVGTSNETSAPQVALHFSVPKMLLILPREHLPTLLKALVPRWTPAIS